ncbi:hypothetical protein [Lentzea sp. CA-135723]|uniref:hypothetical protein n=1 Tax=Lentzea sp. CA-135723 TaxID=3239950 RepID=UPI003D89DB9A
MPSDDVQPTAGVPGNRSHGLAARPDDETGGRDVGSAASTYTLGQPHSHIHTLDELRAVTGDMSEEDVQQALQHFRDVLVPRLVQMVESAGGALDALANVRPIFGVLAVTISNAKLVSDAWAQNVAQTLSALASVLRDLPTKIMREEGPPNWKGLTDEQLDAVIATATSGIPVAWVPRAEILQVLLAADEADQLTVLNAHATAIVDDCAAAVSQARSGEFDELAGYVEEAISAYRAGHLAASQALSASIIDTLLRVTVLEPVKYGYYKTVKDTIAEGPDCVPRVIACLPVLNALENFDGHSDVPAKFNRHASAHAVYAQQYTSTNALISLMLATSMLRQAHHDASEV